MTSYPVQDFVIFLSSKVIDQHYVVVCVPAELIPT